MLQSMDRCLSDLVSKAVVSRAQKNFYLALCLLAMGLYLAVIFMWIHLFYLGVTGQLFHAQANVAVWSFFMVLVFAFGSLLLARTLQLVLKKETSK